MVRSQCKDRQTRKRYLFCLAAFHFAQVGLLSPILHPLNHFPSDSIGRKSHMASTLSCPSGGRTWGMPQEQYSIHLDAPFATSGINYDPLRSGLRFGKYRVRHLGHSTQ
jgi:hypothetical protein